MFNSFNYVEKKDINYFEGWYLKVIDTSTNKSYVIIIGITTNEEDPHSFVQILDGNKNESNYYRYSVENFDYHCNYVNVGNCVLTPDYVTVNEEGLQLNLEFTNKLDIKRNLMQAGTMSYYKMIPMSSYHETIYLKSEVEGSVNKERFSGLAYMEKTYGTKFPDKYLWIQTNHFSKQNSSLLISVADIEVMKKTKMGFFAIVNVNDVEYRFATYNFSHLHLIKSNDGEVELVMFKGRYRCHVNVQINDKCKLKAPSADGAMNIEIEESINSTLNLSLYEDNRLIFTDSATYVGIENKYLVE